MPRPTTDRVIHDYTAKILPATMILTLVIFTVVVLVYSISEKAAVPRDAAVAFAGIVFGFSGLWLLGHLVMYCRGAQAVSPPPLALPLPLAGIATGVGATTMVVPQVSQAAVDVVVPPTVHLHQQQQQQQQQHQRVYQPQNNQYREYEQPQGFPPQLQPHSQPEDQSHRQQREDAVVVRADQREQQHREQQQHEGQQRGQQAEAQGPMQSKQEEQRKHESHRRLTDHKPYVKEPPYPESPPGAYQGGPLEETKKLSQQRIDQHRQQQLEQQPQQRREISGPLENVWQKRPGVPVSQPAPVTVPGPVQPRQQPKGPRTMVGKAPEPPERVSSLQKSLPGTSSRRHRSSSLSSSRVKRPGQLSRGASSLPRPVRGGRFGDASEAIGERGRSRVDRNRPERYQDSEPQPRSASIKSTSLDSATRASLKPAPLNIAKGDRSPPGDERSIEESRATGNHACLPSRRSDQLESDPLSRRALGQTVAKNRVPTIRKVPPTPPNEPAIPVQPAQGEVRDQSIRAEASSSSSLWRSPPPSPAQSARSSKTFDEMGILPGRESTVYEDIRHSMSDFGNLLCRSFTNPRASDSDSRGKPRSLMTDFQTSVVFMPNYNFTAAQLLDPESHEYGSLPFLGQCERDEEKVAAGEELEDRGDVAMVCSSDNAGQWLIKLVELAESSNEVEGDFMK
ncbi:uncharacterized protein BDZ83DRAFT_726651 [Colletotrichum acutatum]|uniref:Uncharacterized protein n=1 Tax=Glomerella acutata TaxID=27357 RepID=A0AAD9D2A9_GLOAC|nr:uncharacterized protein BDZ83DRAFT_726651 [Colletotrichum acutatum]KAK1730421.1 hypothetical protein BDZ83DRAFT_726651 [Colletotrichum acutatum]